MSGGATGAAGPFEIMRGRIYGEVDPADPHNAIIQDLALAPKNARGRVEYVATFALAKPVDMSKALGRADVLRSPTAATAASPRTRTATSG